MNLDIVRTIGGGKVINDRWLRLNQSEQIREASKKTADAWRMDIGVVERLKPEQAKK